MFAGGWSGGEPSLATFLKDVLLSDGTSPLVPLIPLGRSEAEPLAEKLWEQLSLWRKLQVVYSIFCLDMYVYLMLFDYISIKPFLKELGK